VGHLGLATPVRIRCHHRVLSKAGVERSSSHAAPSPCSLAEPRRKQETLPQSDTQVTKPFTAVSVTHTRADPDLSSYQNSRPPDLSVGEKKFPVAPTESLSRGINSPAKGIRRRFPSIGLLLPLDLNSKL
jgi:hypothetical protein